MADETQGQQPTLTADAANAQSIAEAKSAAKAAILADDSIVVESPPTEPTESVEAESTEAEKPEPDTEAKPERKTIAELQALAEEKRRERLQREAQSKREGDARELEEQRREIARRQREFEAREKELEADPFDYLERRKGWDRSQAAEKLVAKQLRPTEAKLEELVLRQQEELQALRERYETDQQSAQERAQQEAQQAYARDVYAKWDSLSSNAERFPTLASFDSEERRFYGDRTINMLRAALEREPTQDEVAEQVEYDLARRFSKRSEPEGNGSSAGESKTKDGSPKGGKKQPLSTLTNDLASESAGSSRNLLDPEVRRRNALIEAERHGLR